VKQNFEKEIFRGRFEEVKEFIDHLDSPQDLNIKKLKVIFDLIDVELIKEYDDGFKWLVKTRLDRTCLNGLNNRRSEMEILAFILNITRGGAQKTKILYQANISYTQLKNYLTYLKEAGFIAEKRIKKRGGIFTTTSKGNLFLLYWAKILQLMASI
jgi:predicted transcriptional regulator